MKKILVVLLLVLGLSLVGCSTNTSSSSSNVKQPNNETTKQTEDPAAFYKGKIINWIIPYAPGGGYDVYSRQLQPYFEKYTGATVVIKNVPGAGSLVGVNQMYEAKNDGLTVGIINNIGLLSSVLAQAEGIKFDLRKFTWIGRMAADAKVLTVSKDFKINDGKDLKSLGRPFKDGATGKGSSNYLDAVIMKEVTGLPVNIVTGFGGSPEVDLSIARGELDGMAGSYGSRLPLVKNGEQKILMIISGTIPDQAKYTSLKDLATNDEALAIYKAYEGMQSSGRGVVAPPGVPESRANFLRDAFKKAIEDPVAAKEFTAADRPLDYASAEEVKRLVSDALDSPKKFVEILKDNI